MKRIIATLALLAATAPAAAEPQGFAPSGLYLFHTLAQVDDRPVCMETWEFLPDGVLLVESGQERVRKRYRMEPQAAGAILAAEAVETNGRPDCMGNRTKRLRPGEKSTFLMPMNDGTVMTCPVPQAAPDGAPYVSGCYGKIVPADQAG